MSLYTIFPSVDTTPKEMLPPHKRFTKGAQQMSCSKQMGGSEAEPKVVPIRNAMKQLND